MATHLLYVLCMNMLTNFYCRKTQKEMATMAPPIPTLLLSLFEKCKSMDQLKQIHSQIIRIGLHFHPTVHNKVISFCCTKDCGCVKYARHMFDTVPQPHNFIWNTMIKGYFRVSSPGYAVSMYAEMLKQNVKPDNYTFPFLIKGLPRDLALCYGRVIHAHVCIFGFGSNPIVQNNLICMYARCDRIHLARGVFERSSKDDVVTWNAMLSGYNKSKLFYKTRELFQEMEKNGVLPTTVSLVSGLSASSKLKDLETGKRIHGYIISGRVEANLVLENALIGMYAVCEDMDEAITIFQSMEKRDVISWTSIVTGYANCGQIDQARKYFDQMPERDSISWTAMIDGYIRINQFKPALLLFREMQNSEAKPDEFTMVSVLTACAQLGALELGEWAKAYIDKTRIKNDVQVANTLIDMYFKCGEVKKAIHIFDEMAFKDKFSWTTMIAGLAINGQGKEALDMFSNMKKASIKPDEVTYVGILSACTHAGMVDDGKKCLYDMKYEHGIEPNVAHYGCMVDLLGRAGCLAEAYDLVMHMRIKPNSVIWGALLGACRVHKNIDIAEVAAQKLLELEPENGAVYVLLCNIYAACNAVEKLGETRRLIMEKGIKKTPGCSSIEMDGTVHEFVAGASSHPQTRKIYAKLEEMMERLKIEGYVPDMSELAPDMGEEDKENALCRHSEK